MRRLVTIAIILMLVLMVNKYPIRAQEHPKWPPDPDALFADGVDVVKVDEIYPYSLVALVTTQTRCGRIVDGTSEAAVIKRDGNFYICELATGKLSPAVAYTGYMPDGQDTDGYGLRMSPDNKWALFEQATERYDLNDLAGYELATGNFVDLGLVPRPSGYVTQQGWATNTDWFLIDDGMPEWSSTYAHVATIPNANSMRVVLENMRLPIVYFDNPPRLEAWFTPTNSSEMHQDHFDCELSVYYFLTHSVTIYHTGNLCIPEYGQTLGDGYYRDVQPDGKAWLVRFNPVTRKRSNLYYGEIEQLYWVSDDGNYALVMLDSSGKVDTRPGYDLAMGYEMNFFDITAPVITLIELSTGKILYSMPAREDLADQWPWRVLGNTDGLVTPVDGQSFIINFPSSLYPQDPLIRVQNGVANVDLLDGATTLVIDAQHLILELVEDDAYQYVIYDIAAHRAIPITAKTKDYWFSFDKAQDGSTVISVRPRSFHVENTPEEMKYTVELPS